MKERLSFQLRGEFYNAFNHAQWTTFNNAAKFNGGGQQINTLFGQAMANSGSYSLRCGLVSELTHFLRLGVDAVTVGLRGAYCKRDAIHFAGVAKRTLFATQLGIRGFRRLRGCTLQSGCINPADEVLLTRSAATSLI